MDGETALIAVIVGFLQGIFEWLPISSEGNITIALAVLGGFGNAGAVSFALFLHTGTAISAVAYYRDELAAVIRSMTEWRPSTAFDDSTAELSYLLIATFSTGIVGLPAYALFGDIIGELHGGIFIILIGVSLILTGVIQRLSGDLSLGSRKQPDLIDAVVVGALQGFAVLPGISRSGVTASALLFRSHDGPSAFRLSFLLSIPAAIGGGLLAALEDGIGSVSPFSALIAIAVSAIVGYLTIDALMRIVERISFWKICLGLGGVAVLGGMLLFTVNDVSAMG
ncbi:undecaprenyl-diphosphate phosphatase [Halocatena salina]|uniref:Undecaprenyl-diphosphatase n=1 Tax=Halocatena salina TaxID=2934340 RepID=A0A8U0A6T2_9EURY|nr:undecaprenyl-diphosphate phosphatase [Halocatena salina]UPM43637.1 undecaprenyl-diphosphate phosphatase [Halocatena salina]